MTTNLMDNPPSTATEASISHAGKRSWAPCCRNDAPGVTDVCRMGTPMTIANAACVPDRDEAQARGAAPAAIAA